MCLCKKKKTTTTIYKPLEVIINYYTVKTVPEVMIEKNRTTNESDSVNNAARKTLFGVLTKSCFWQLYLKQSLHLLEENDVFIQMTKGFERRNASFIIFYGGNLTFIN